jgi:hypothetical protein
MEQPRGNPHKGGEAALHTPRVSAAELQVYLKGINYPADKQKLVTTARQNKATQPVMDFINRLPEKQYASPIMVEQEFGKMKQT